MEPAIPPDMMFLANILVLRGILGGLEHGLDGVLECEVERLCGEVTEYVGHVTSPEGDDTFISECAHGAVDDTGVGLVEPSLFDHLRLVLDQELDTLDGGGGGL